MRDGIGMKIAKRKNWGSSIGHLYLHSKDFEMVTYELVAISKGRVWSHEGRFYWNIPPTNDVKYSNMVHLVDGWVEYYNVLSILWNSAGTTAYRTGIGEIPATIWEKQEREVIDIILG